MPNKSKKPIIKRWWFWAIIVVLFFAILGLDDANDNNTAQDTVEGVKEETPTVEEAAKEDTKVEESEAETTEAETKDDKELLQEAIKEKESLVWRGDVRNDVTGNWRLATYASGNSLETFAAEYYKAFFESDDEIHAVIDKNAGVTGNISVLFSNIIDVTLHEYIDKEENDAKVLFGGRVLKEYWINLTDGSIEEIQ